MRVAIEGEAVKRCAPVLLQQVALRAQLAQVVHANRVVAAARGRVQRGLRGKLVGQGSRRVALVEPRVPVVVVLRGLEIQRREGDAARNCFEIFRNYRLIGPKNTTTKLVRNT